MKFFAALVILWRAMVVESQHAKVEGCFMSDELPSLVSGASGGGGVDACLSACEAMHYGYALLRVDACKCANSPAGRAQDADACARNVSGAIEAYRTAVETSGPPAELRVSDVGETSFEIAWRAPVARRPGIVGYRVLVNATASPSPLPLAPLDYAFSDNTFRTRPSDLHPGTVYSVSVRAVYPHGDGARAEAHVETLIGEPEPEPPTPVVIERHKDNAVVRIPKVYNYNGPITRYRIVVVNEERQRGFDPDFLKSYRDAVKEDIPYYIAAELDQSDVEHDFTVGNRRTYNGYYNAPLPHSKDVLVSLGVVSVKGPVTKVRYARAGRVTVFRVHDDEPASPLLMALGVAVAIGVALLVIGIGFAVFLRRRVVREKRARLTRSTGSSGPCIEIENTGFIPDEDDRVDHYGDLKRRLWNIPRNFLEVDVGSTVGVGGFGRFVRGRVRHRGAPTPCTVQSVSDGDLSKEDRKAMLADLDASLKTDGHENVIALVGICELPDTLYVVLENTQCTLKELLLSSRRTGSQIGNLQNADENRLLFQIAVDAAKGMVYMSNKKILHRRLACRNVQIVNGTTPKIAGFGLSHVHPENQKPDYTRWTAQEMFKQNNYTSKSDVWSFGCVLWELFSIGGTLYPQVESKNVPVHVLRGARPKQLPYISDALFQVCVNCWQTDLDERPTFPQILFDLESLTNQNILGLISVSHLTGLNYEPYHPELEIIS